MLEARGDPAMRDVVEASFLHEDVTAALEAFEGSEHWARISRQLRRAQITPPARVLDFGGGRGLVAACLARAGFQAVLCEPNPSAVCGTGAAAGLARGEGGGFSVCNALGAIPARELPFAAAVCRAVLHHIHPLAPALREVAAVLEPGGLFCASDEPVLRDESQLDAFVRAHPFSRFGVDEWAGTAAHYTGALDEAGFVDIRVSFPVAFGDYARHIHPGAPRPLAALGYARYRLRSAARPPLGQPRMITARRP